MIKQMEIKTEKERVTKNGLLEDIGEIIKLVNEYKLSEEFFEQAGAHLQKVASLLRINEKQAALFSLVLEYSDDESVSVSTIAKAMDCGKIQMLQHLDDLEKLENKSLIRAEHDRYSYRSRASFSRLPCYHVPMNVIKILRTGRYIRNSVYCGLSPQGFFDTVSEIMISSRENNINVTSLITEMKLLFSSNIKSSFVHNCRSYELPFKTGMELAAFCCAWLEEGAENISLNELRPFLGITLVRHLECQLKTGDHKLIQKGIIINGNDLGLADTETWTLSEKTKETFLADINLKERKQKSKRNLIKTETIQERIMFYPEKVNERIKELSRLLSEENFALIKTRLAQQNMSTVFTIFFQGAPGTGKTETVYQIARMTGRDIFYVDISETKSQWFGESEKRIKAVFDYYKSMLKGNSLTPIFLFNEADAVLSKRQELGDIRRGPAQTENAIQNIILQEIENLHGGILIATTNMVNNFDKAFERRFLYKIEFEKPDCKARMEIWRSRLAGLSVEDAEILSRHYDFSGGQIENVVSKYTINQILNGCSLTLDGITTLCENELLDKGAKRIGF